MTDRSGLSGSREITAAFTRYSSARNQPDQIARIRRELEDSSRWVWTVEVDGARGGGSDVCDGEITIAS